MLAFVDQKFPIAVGANTLIWISAYSFGDSLDPVYIGGIVMASDFGPDFNNYNLLGLTNGGGQMARLTRFVIACDS
jgi:hypothetical protein